MKGTTQLAWERAQALSDSPKQSKKGEQKEKKDWRRNAKNAKNWRTRKSATTRLQNVNGSWEMGTWRLVLRS